LMKQQPAATESSACNASCTAAASSSLHASAGAAGFVRLSRLPEPSTPRARALHYAGVAFFWSIAAHVGPGKPVHWGVTANLLVQRREGIKFDLSYPKTGGGEDVAFCIDLQVDCSNSLCTICAHACAFEVIASAIMSTHNAEWRLQLPGLALVELTGICQETVGCGCMQEATGLPLISWPEAEVEHPYWNNGTPHLSRFFNWAFGDGLLLDRYCQKTYRSAPNITELSLLILLLAPLPVCACALGALDRPSSVDALLAMLVATVAMQALDCCLILADLLRRTHVQATLNNAKCNSHGHCTGDGLLERMGMDGSEGTAALVATAVHTKAVLIASEAGRLAGHLSHGTLWRNWGRRFKWWGDSRADIVVSEQLRALATCAGHCTVCLLAVSLALFLRRSCTPYSAREDFVGHSRCQEFVCVL
jgi:hypothetical protein